MGNFISCIQRREKGLSVLALAASQVTSIQNNQYAIVIHFGLPALGSCSLILLLPLVLLSVTQVQVFPYLLILGFLSSCNSFSQRFNVFKNSKYFSVLVFSELSVFSSRNIKSNCILQEEYIGLLQNINRVLIRKEASSWRWRKIWGGLKVGPP